MNTYCNIDLSTKTNSMTSILQNNLQFINKCTSKIELVSELKRIFSENHLCTAASNRLLYNVSSKKNYELALATVYDSLLYGSKLGVNQR